MEVAVSPDVLRSIASLSVSASKDKVTPVLMHVALRRDGDYLEAHATDRYMVASGRYRVGEEAFHDWDNEEVTMVSTDLLKRAMAGYKTIKFHGVNSVIGDSAGIVYIDVSGDFTVREQPMRGSFPAVWKLYPEQDEVQGKPHFFIKPEYLARIGKIEPPLPRKPKSPTWGFYFTANTKPVVAYYDGDNYSMRTAIQPALAQS